MDVVVIEPDVDFVLWDHDGVIVDTEHLFFEATKRALLHFGVEITLPRWQRVQAMGMGLERVASETSRDRLDFKEIRRARDDFYEELLEERPVLIDGALAALDAIAGRFRTALVTTSLRRFIDQLHGESGVLEHFELVVTSEDCSHYKPHPEPYQRAMERMGVTPNRGVAIEDSPRGMGSAVAAGLRCFVVRSDFMRDYAFEEAHAVLDRIDELPSRLGV